MYKLHFIFLSPFLRNLNKSKPKHITLTIKTVNIINIMIYISQILISEVQSTQFSPSKALF